ncbi:terminase small subunit [Sporosarcina sp.]|uniref:terminase small subunit n=1 Tax=Sporosarcina sp. TaxID=49982 RepID=UPI002614BF14|nr:terminase small subunit [Sporosarcina sp.]
MKQNARQEVFCKEFLIDLIATQAIRAGYSERTARSQGQRLLTNVDILARVKELKSKRVDELELDAYWVLKRLKDISDRSMQAVPVMEYDQAEQCLVETGEYEFDSTGANKVTELIGKHIGMFDPKLNRQLNMTEVQIAKVKAETEFIEERTKLIRGTTKDTGLLDAFLEGRKLYEQNKD